MKISFVKMNGFRGAKHEVTVPLGSGFTVVTGRNGSGKSTIFDAIEFVLTGKIGKFPDAKESGESLENYVWWRGDDDFTLGSVSLGIIDDEGKEYVLERDELESIVPDSKLLARLFDLPDRNVDEEIEYLCRTSILRDESIADLSIDLKETEKFQILQTAIGTLDLERYRTKLDNAAQLLEQRSSSRQQTIQEHREELEDVIDKMNSAKAQLKSEDDVRLAQSKLWEAVGGTEASLPGLLSHSDRLLAQSREAVSYLRRLLHDIAGLRANKAYLSRAQLTASLEELAAKKAELEQQKAIAQAQFEREEEAFAEARSGNYVLANLAELSTAGKNLGLQDGKCPLCGSEVDEKSFEAHLTLIERFISSTEDDVKEIQRRRNEARSLVDDTEERLNETIQEISQNQSALDDVSESVSQLLERAAGLGLKLSSIDDNGREQVAKELERLENRIGSIEPLMAVLEARVVVGELETLGARREDLRAKIDSLEREISSIAAAQDRAKQANSEIRRFAGELFDERAYEMAPIMDEIYKRLRPHADWASLTFSIRGDVTRLLSLRATNDLESDRGVNPRFVFSSGQRRAAGLAFLLSVFLSRSWSSFETLMLDDPVQHIDDFRALQLVEVLSALRMSGRQIICTVEDRDLAELLCRRLRARGEGEGRKIEMRHEGGNGIAVSEKPIVYPLPESILLHDVS